jgi:hypothetical protein
MDAPANPKTQRTIDRQIVTAWERSLEPLRDKYGITPILHCHRCHKEIAWGAEVLVPGNRIIEFGTGSLQKGECDCTIWTAQPETTNNDGG